MSAFARASRALHSNAHLSTAASYVPASGRALPTTAVRVILSEPIDPLASGMGPGAMTTRREASILLDALPFEPWGGDTLLIGAVTYRVSKPERDVEGTAWRLTLAETT